MAKCLLAMVHCARRVLLALLLSFLLPALNCSPATLTLVGAPVSQGPELTTCTYSSVSEDISGNWTVNCATSGGALSISPAVNGSVCTSYGGLSEDIAGSWTVTGCVSASPTIVYTSPATSGGTYPGGIPYILGASASAPVGRTIQLVQFFRDGTLIGSATLNADQYTLSWWPGPGTYSVTAIATDSSGATAATSSSVQMTFAVAAAPSFYYVHTDHLGTPRLVTRPNDNIAVWKWDNTEPFGNSSPDENPAGLGPFTYNLRFPGQYFDVETGTHYNYFRDYDPSIGRYIQSDPVGLMGGLSTYGYASSAPLTFVDADGRRFMLPIVTGIVGALTGGLGNLAYQLAVNEGHYECIDWSNVGISAGVGGVAGAALPVVAGGVGAAASIGALANVIQYGITQEWHGEPIAPRE